MSVSAQRDLASTVTVRPTKRRRHSVPLAIRLGIGLDRSMWPLDRALAELRWGALTAGVMLAIALPAAILTGRHGGYTEAAIVCGVAFAALVVTGWSPVAARFANRMIVRRGIGPLLILIALLAAGPYDPSTLEPPVGRPLIILALTYAALTPGFPIAAGLVGLASIGLLATHATIESHTFFDDDSVRFLVRWSVTFLGAGAVYFLDRGLRRERRRAESLAARKVARADQLEGLQRIISRFDGSRSVDAVMQDVVDDVAATFDITLVSAYLPDSNGRLSMVGVAGYPEPFHVIEIGVGIIGRAAATRETVFVPDVLADPDYRAARADVRSEVAVPVLHGDELLGIVNFEGTAEKPIGAGHVAVAEMLARSIAAALRTARLDEERRQRLHAIERVLEVSRGLAADLDRSRVVASVVEAAHDLFDADVVEFASRGADGMFRVDHCVGCAPDRVALAIEPGDGIAGETIASGTRVIWTGADGGPAGLGLPIRIEGETSAVLTTLRDRGDAPFSELDLGIADLLVTQIEVALQNADLHGRVSEAAVRDTLTGLLNRRYFDEAVEAAFANARRSGTPLSLIVFDLDRFSAVNNEHGHAVGDAVLRRVARAMAGAVRVGDTIARYGGEEFVLIAPGANATEAVGVAERVRAAVVEASGSAPDVGSHGVPITVSAGVASLLGDELDGRSLFRAADSALLAAKRAGRDRVVSV
jgi:diguanylate cyclase (GGDEF)-like protein